MLRNKTRKIIVTLLMCLLTVLPVLSSYPPAANAATYYTIDSNLLIPKSVHPAELDNFIRLNRPNSPLIGLGQAWVNAQNKYGIDAVYLMAHAILESAWGTSRIAQDKKNLYGYGAYDSDPYNGAWTFTSFEQCIDVVSGKILENYLSPSGKYYHGSTLRGINVHYATSVTWANSIAGIMNQYYGQYPFLSCSPPDPFLSRAFVAQLYRNALGRDADTPAMNAWANAMTSFTLPRRLVAEYTIMSRESRTVIVADYYRSILGRDPDSEGLNNWVNVMDPALTSSPRSERTVHSQFYGGDEYFNKLSDISNTGYVTSLYQRILLRDPDSPGLEGWVSALNNGMSRNTVAYSFLSSIERYRLYIASVYQQILNRQPESAALENWANLMNTSSYPLNEERLKREFYSGEEFWANGVNGYVGYLYQGILERSADPIGLAGYRQALVGGMSRYTITNAMFSGLEYHRNYANQLYEDILERTADGPGLNTWTNVLNSGMREEELEAIFYGSDEYYQRFCSSSNDQYIALLYTEILGRTPLDSEKLMWLDALNNGWSRKNVALAFINSREERSSFIRGLYTQLLGREADATGLNGWLNAMEGGMTRTQVMASFYASYEYTISHF